MLVGFSKLPMPVEVAFERLRTTAFPLAYDLDGGGLSRQAARFSQLTFGKGRYVRDA